MKKAFIAQARMTSSRLPGKVGMDICGETALYRMIERMRLTKHDMDIIIATTTNSDDDIVVKTAEDCGVKVFRGSENHVLSRYYYAAKEYGVDIISRVTCDDLLFDPRWNFDTLMDEFLADGTYDYCTAMDYNAEENKWTDNEPCCGCGTEIFTFEGIERCFNETDNPYCTEHVTPYFYMNPHLFKCMGHGSGYKGPSINPDKYGTSLDTEEDLILLRKIYEELYPKNPQFTMREVIEAYQRHPEWCDIIADIVRTPVTYHGEGETKTIWESGLNENIIE